MPPKDPRKRLREIRDLQKSALALTPERNRLIRQLLQEGDSQRKVARDAGLTQPQISEIAIGG